MHAISVLWGFLDSVQQLNFHRIYLGKYRINFICLQFENKLLIFALQDILCGVENPERNPRTTSYSQLAQTKQAMVQDATKDGGVFSITKTLDLPKSSSENIN